MPILYAEVVMWSVHISWDDRCEFTTELLIVAPGMNTKQFYQQSDMIFRSKVLLVTEIFSQA